MSEQQEHLKNLLKQFRDLSLEFEDLNRKATVKRELILKVQGAIEYLQQTGVLPPEEETPAEFTEEVVTETEEETT
jgi:uncharacterized coiled-coil DUF342 family protein